MGLWNNSWVKNLPVHPLAPRRKAPGQLNPHPKTDRKSTRLNSSHMSESRMPSSA